MNNDNIEIKKLQEEHFRETKIYSEYTAVIYEELNSKKTYKIDDCGSYLIFKNFFEIEKLKLAKANFCRCRLCPMCIIRKSAKIRANLLKVLSYAVFEKKYMLVHLTLTVRNVKRQDLKNTVDEMLKAFNLMIDRDIFKAKGKSAKNIVKGLFRNLEITYVNDPTKKSYDTFHPHFHVVMAVEKSYFTGKDYLKQNDWCLLWQSCMKTKYKPICYIEKCYYKNEQGKKIKDLKTVDDIEKVAFEASKYVAKSSDYLYINDLELSKKNLLTLDLALSGRKLFHYGGDFGKIKKQLNLEDEEKGDLIHINGEEIETDMLDYIYEVYRWDKLTKDYTMSETLTKEEYKKTFEE